MRRKRLQARLDTLVPAARAGIVVIVPDAWSAIARDAYDAASAVGDTVRQAALIDQATGAGVDRSVVRIIEIQERPDGPP
jgi:hypothetical protein